MFNKHLNAIRRKDATGRIAFRVHSTAAINSGTPYTLLLPSRQARTPAWSLIYTLQYVNQPAPKKVPERPVPPGASALKPRFPDRSNQVGLLDGVERLMWVEHSTAPAKFDETVSCTAAFPSVIFHLLTSHDPERGRARAMKKVYFCGTLAHLQNAK